MQNLNEKEQKIINLRHNEGMSFKEIAERFKGINKYRKKQISQGIVKYEKKALIIKGNLMSYIRVLISSNTMKDFYIEPPIGLLEKIMKRIHREERILVLRRIILFSITLVISLLDFSLRLICLYLILASPGFLKFSSLIFSDFSTVATYWQSFTMTLLETLPALSLALFLAVLAHIFTIN